MNPARSRRKPPAKSAAVVEFDVFVDESGQMGLRSGDVNAMVAVWSEVAEENRDLVAGLVGDVRERIHGERSAKKPVKAAEWNDGEIQRLRTMLRDRDFHFCFLTLVNESRTDAELAELVSAAQEEANAWFGLIGSGPEHEQMRDDWHATLDELVTKYPRYAHCVMNILYGVISWCVDRNAAPVINWVFDEKINPGLMPFVGALSFQLICAAVGQRYKCSLRDAIGGRSFPSRDTKQGSDNTVDGLVLADGLAYMIGTGMRELAGKGRIAHVAWREAFEELTGKKLSGNHTSADEGDNHHQSS